MTKYYLCVKNDKGDIAYFSKSSYGWGWSFNGGTHGIDSFDTYKEAEKKIKYIKKNWNSNYWIGPAIFFVLSETVLHDHHEV